MMKGGDSCLLLCSGLSSPGARGGVQGCSFLYSQVTEQLGEHPLSLPSGQCLDCAWLEVC
jgi:hypothetical protein